MYEAVAIALAGTATGGVAHATIPSNAVISACCVQSGGALRVIDADTSSCNPTDPGTIERGGAVRTTST